MKHTIENPTPTPGVLRAVIKLVTPLREIEQTNRSKISKTPMKYALASFSTFMKCSEVINTLPSKINDNMIFVIRFNKKLFYSMFLLDNSIFHDIVKIIPPFSFLVSVFTSNRDMKSAFWND